ncbi:hypothetical protein AMAG_18926 [Allomyces macrogynus ATCC 38327]|uniref:Uncharacterized protein n=1 Tax=Allomyces macrogynus (strain ATCC 38327) TaxID=578462 RepID=A0A0L0SKC1_ALLM3|nr:hypothetical protein AMAG_18926 [Allomyces macrogynus ATCC 38327]|eukprot:KNE62850.1 hypothetical protein AMAG_18926 [Allomyces macrogynus ATCC 38327]
MYTFVKTHRAVLCAALADPGAAIPDTARPVDADGAVFDQVVAIFALIDQGAFVVDCDHCDATQAS